MGTCYECGHELSETGQCINVGCRVAHEQATRAAAMPKAKATAAATRDNPSAFTAGGRVD